MGQNQSGVVKEFSRYAHSYGEHNVIQSKVAQELVAMVPKQTYNTVIDVGCGRGALYSEFKKREINYKNFYALDYAEEMLKLHPDALNVIKWLSNFSEDNFLNNIPCDGDTLLLSSSALQWSTDLTTTLQSIARKVKKAYFAIFTANTFKQLQTFTALSSPIYSSEVLQEEINRYFQANYRVHTYALTFQNTKALFTYIKKSGVSGGNKRLTFKEAKRVITEYPLTYLEFEVLFVEATSKLK
jgi:malonyl-CoA O-methyltransferase